jgi:hypothetical protein
MKYLLVTGNIDYADEFYCEMFGVFTEDEWNELCKKTKKFFKNHSEVECYFGTNEQLIFEDYAHWVGSFKKKEISKEEADFLKKTFGDTFGTGSNAFDIHEQEEEDDGWGDDDDEEEEKE